jgi:hypothetical protein
MYLTRPSRCCSLADPWASGLGPQVQKYIAPASAMHLEYARTTQLH